jgi:uroporphyrinogen III methyltransferase/synthase
MRVLVARARPGPSEIAERLRGDGVEVVEAPSVRVEELEDFAALDRALGESAQYRAVVFGCAAGVVATRQRRVILPSVIAVGERARAALVEAGIVPQVLVAGACRDALSRTDWLGARLLVVVGDSGRKGLVVELQELGAHVDTVVAYREVLHMPAELPPVDLIALPSSSAARALLRSAHAGVLREVPMVAIGARTAAEARSLGAAVVLCSQEDTVSSLVAAVLERCHGKT